MICVLVLLAVASLDTVQNTTDGPSTANTRTPLRYVLVSAEARRSVFAFER